MPSTVTSRLEGLETSVVMKAPCRVATTSNITLSGLQAIDGVTVTAGDRVLVKNQTTSSQNGIYTAQVSSWIRALDFNGSRDVVGGTQIYVIEGTANSNSYWRVTGTDTSVAIGTDAITFAAGLADDSAGLTFLQSGTGAVARTAQAKMREVITPYDFGATGDGVADDTAELQAALTAAIAQGKILDLAYGTYKVTASTTGSGNVRIINSGGAVINAASGTYSSSGVLVLSGSATQVEELNASPAAGDVSLTAASNSSFAVGDIGAIYNPTDSSWSAFRAYYRAGEFIEIGAVSGASITLRNPLYAGYTAANVDCYKISSITGYIKDIIITSAGSPTDLIIIDYANGFRIINPKLTNANNSCIVVKRSVKCTVENPEVTNVGDGGDDYGISFSSSQHCRVMGGNIYGKRHAVAMGNADETNGVPCRDVIVTKATLKNDRSTAVHCADVHGSTESCGYDDCTIFGAFSPQGKNSILTNSRVYSMSVGSCVYAAEIIGGVHTIAGNTFYVHTDPSATSRGIIDFGGNTDAITANTTETTTIVVKNNVFISTACGATTSAMSVRNRGSTSKVNIEFTGAKLNLNNFGQVVFLDRPSGTAASDYLIVDDIATGLTGKTLLNVDANYGALAVMRLQAQTWSEVVTTDTSAPTKTGTAKTFKWAYPRIPDITVSRSKRGYFGNRIGIAYADPTSTTACTPNISTDDATNFASASTVTLSVRVGINEV